MTLHEDLLCVYLTKITIQGITEVPVRLLVMYHLSTSACMSASFITLYNT